MVEAHANYPHGTLVSIGLSSPNGTRQQLPANNGKAISPIRPAMSAIFQFNAAEEWDEIEERFQFWLENDVLVNGLEDWRLSLNL